MKEKRMNQPTNPTRHGTKKKRKLRLNAGQIILLLGLLLCAGMLAVFGAYYSSENQRIQSQYAEEAARAKQTIDSKLNAFKNNTAIRSYIDEYSAEFHVHPAYIAAIILNESSFRTDATSSVGAMGLMQLLPSSGEWIAPKIGIYDYTDDLLYDGKTNVHMGAWYLNYLSGKFDSDPILVACAYHAGAGNVQSWLSKYSTDGKTLTFDQIPYDNTRTYAKRVVETYDLYLRNFYPES